MASIPIQIRVPDHYAELLQLRVLCALLLQRLGGTVEFTDMELFDADAQAISIEMHPRSATVRSFLRLSTIVDTEPRV